MASPAFPPERQPTSAVLSSDTPRAIRDALIDSERAEFEQRYAEEMARAAHTLDLTGVLGVISTFRKVAEVTQRQGVDAHRAMMDRVGRLRSGEHVPTVPGHVHKADINERLGR